MTIFHNYLCRRLKGGGMEIKMNQQEQAKKQLSPKQKLNILFGTLAGRGVGGVLGIIVR